MPTIVLTDQEKEEYFYHAMCNGFGQLAGYDIQLDYSKKEYKEAKERLAKTMEADRICFEDVLIELLRGGGTLTFIDHYDGGTKIPVTLKEVHERVGNANQRHLADMMNQNDDADTADDILQTVIYGKAIYG